jgi:hypothetical protein
LPTLGPGLGISLLQGAAGRRRLDKFTFAHGALMRFAGVFDVILELAVSLRQDRTYNVLSMRRKKTAGGIIFDCLAKLELMRHRMKYRLAARLSA